MLITIKDANFRLSTQEIRIQRVKIHKKYLGRLKDLNRPWTIGLAAGLHELIGNVKTFHRMGLIPTDIKLQSKKKLFSIFPYFSLFFFKPIQYYLMWPTKIWIGKKFQDLSENGTTSDQGQTRRQKNKNSIF